MSWLAAKRPRASTCSPASTAPARAASAARRFEPSAASTTTPTRRRARSSPRTLASTRRRPMRRRGNRASGCSSMRFASASISRSRPRSVRARCRVCSPRPLRRDSRCASGTSGWPMRSCTSQRVRQRVRQGGHDIPESDIRRRYEHSRLNLVQLLPALAGLRVYDNSAVADPAAGRAPQPVLLLHMDARHHRRSARPVGNTRVGEADRRGGDPTRRADAGVRHDLIYSSRSGCS